MEPTLAGFQNVKLDHVPLACPFSAYPEIVERFSGRIISWSTLNPIADFVKKRTGRSAWHKDFRTRHGFRLRP
jgi:hypothetical protein